MSDPFIPFNRPCRAGNEETYIAQAFADGHIAGDGPFTDKCQALIEDALGAPRAFLTTSCTHALEMAALLLGVGRGDEVIVPSFTFVTTANAFVLRGARPVFVDIRPDTLNLDETRIEELITPRTRAIVAVHYGGVGCEMDVILDVAGRHNLVVVEDNAHGLFATYRGRPLGTFGAFASQSFHETKNFTCGEGGALIVNDPALLERAEIVREKGTNRSKFFRGQVDKYTWVDVGSSYLMSDILAAALYAQLEQRERIQATRRRVWEAYAQGLADWADANGVTLPHVPAHCGQAYHLFYMLLPSLEKRQALMAHLRERGVGSAFHYLPLHVSHMGRSFGTKAEDCPVTIDVSDRLLRLPLFNEMTDDDAARVVEAVKAFT